MIGALVVHVSNILATPSESFCISPFIFFLVAAASFRVARATPGMGRALALVGLWSGIWIGAYLLVPDASAYRRGISFSAVFALAPAFAFGLRRRKGGMSLLPVALGFLLVSARFPHELAVSNYSVMRSAMSTVCNTAPAIRALLTYNAGGGALGRLHYLVIPQLGSAGEIACLRSAARSNEWRRCIPATRIISPAFGQLRDEISKLPSSATAIVYCSPETRRDPDIAMLCDGTAEGVSVGASIAIPGDGASRWILVKNGLAELCGTGAYYRGLMVGGGF